MRTNQGTIEPTRIETTADGGTAIAVSAPTDARGRFRHIEVIRGIACLMVVAYHVIGNDPSHGMKMPVGSPWWMVPRVLDLVQMPLFAFVSGWVFSIPTSGFDQFGTALGRKLLRLALPMASVSLLYLGLDKLRGRADGIGPIDVLVTPYQHLWYLQASMWLVAAASVALFLARGQPKAMLAAVLAISLPTFLYAPHFGVDLLAVEQALYLAPFFFSGLVANRFGVERAARAEKSTLTATLAGLAMLCVVTAALIHGAMPETALQEMPTHTVTALMLGVSLALFLMLLRPQSRLLESLGERSLTIYLFHVFFAAPMREVLLRLWPNLPIPLLFTAGFIVGVVAPWLLHDLIRRHRWSAFLFLGDTTFGGRK